MMTSQGPDKPMFTETLSGMVEGHTRDADLKEAGERLILNRSAVEDNGPDADLWNRVFSIRPQELVAALLAGLPVGSLLIVSFYGKGGAVLLARTPEGQIVLDAERAPGAPPALFLRKLGTRTGTAGPGFRHMLHNLAVAAKALGVPRIELVAPLADAPGWAACGALPNDIGWTERLAPALSARLDWLQSLPSGPRLSESAESTLRRLLADPAPATLWKLTEAVMTVGQHRLADLLVAEDLPATLGEDGAEAPEPVRRAPNFAASLDLRKARSVNRMKTWLAQD